MSELKLTTGLVASAGVSPHPTRATLEQNASAPYDALFVIPRRGGGLRASIRGHLLELAEPNSVHRLAPTPDDLFVASIASDLGWTARHFLRAHGLPDDVSVSAHWRRLENPPRPIDVSMTVTVCETTEALSDRLEHALAERIAARSLDEPPRLHLRCAEGDVVPSWAGVGRASRSFR